MRKMTTKPVSNPIGYNRTGLISTKLSIEESKGIAQLCERTGAPMSTVVRGLIRFGVLFLEKSSKKCVNSALVELTRIGGNV